MKNSKGYNGYKNYAQWNQSLWINNDEGLYNMARDFCKRNKRQDAASMMLDCLADCGSDKTPDGVKWSKSGILAGMVGM